MAARDDASPGPSVVLIGIGFEAYGRLPVAGSQRVSDHFNERRSMLVLEDVQLERCDAFASTAHEVAVSREDVLLVVPVVEPGGEPASARMVPKERRRVRMLVGDWVAEGDIHVVPRTSVERFVNTGQGDFVPLTRVRVIAPDGSAREEDFVLVHRRHLRLLTPVAEDEPLDEAP